MKKTKCPIDKIIQILAEAELPNTSIADACRNIPLQEALLINGEKNIKAFLPLKLKT